MFVEKYFKTNIKDLFLIQFIFEGYEGIATVTTIDKDNGIIELKFFPDFIHDINKIIESLKKDYYFLEI